METTIKIDLTKQDINYLQELVRKDLKKIKNNLKKTQSKSLEKEYQEKANIDIQLDILKQCVI